MFVAFALQNCPMMPRKKMGQGELGLRREVMEENLSGGYEQESSRPCSDSR